MEETTNSPSQEASKEAVSSEPRTRAILWGALVLLAFLLGMAAGYQLWARPLQDRLTAMEQQAAAGADTAAANEQVRRYDVPVDDDPILGNVDAPITIVEFSDYECPYCRRWHLEVFPLIQEKYGEKVRFVYRDFPLYSIHPNAGPAAEAANCANEQGRYWEFNQRVFQGTLPLSPTTYESYASEIGLNLDDFKKCFEEQRYEEEVKADYNYASQLGVRSTPTFFINGLAVVGAQPFEVFEQIIDMELAGEIPQ